jgi:hypothetical protein
MFATLAGPLSATLTSPIYLAITSYPTTSVVACATNLIVLKDGFEMTDDVEYTISVDNITFLQSGLW